MTESPNRGEIWFADLDPVRGHEQGRRRPVLVVSHNKLNSGPAELVIVLPLTSKPKPNIPTLIPLQPTDENGLTQPSTILCDQIRSISRLRLAERLGVADEGTLLAVGNILKALLRL